MASEVKSTDRAEDVLQLVCVSHRPEMYGQHIGDNQHVNGHNLIRYDNSVENVSIPERYNHFIDHDMGDGWVIFLHHDMAFHEDPLPVLRDVPTTSIYGVVGTITAVGNRYVHVGRGGRFGVTIERGRTQATTVVGQIRCDPKLVSSGIFGDAPASGVLPVVDTVDCCCLIVHSTLIREHGLRFDTQFRWHFYSEDFSLNARERHQISTRVVQMKCGHYGFGRLDAEFYDTQRLLVEKYRGVTFSSTCYLPPTNMATERLAKRRGVLLQF